MAESTAYRFGRFLGSLPPTLYVFAGVCFALWVAVQAYSSGSEEAAARAKAAAAPKPPTAEQRCQAEREQKLAEYRANMEKGLPWQAATALRVCSAVLKDAELQRLVVEAETADAVKTATDKTQPSSHRLAAVERIEKAAPERAAEFAKLKVQLKTAIAREEERERRAIAAKKRSEGVSIGMSKEDVLASSWGRPERINRSIYKFGEREQWVYGGGNYLYFHDGVLNSIQTGN